jgi:hypothetical protein
MDSVYMFKYDQNGLPVSVSFEFPPDLILNWQDISYKSGTQLIEKVWQEGYGEDLALFKFEYNAQGKPVKAKTFVGHEFTYQYNEKGEINRVDVKRWGNPQEYHYETVFDSKGNLIEFYRKFPANEHLNDGFKAEYSDTENTIAGLSVLNLSNHLGMHALFPGSNVLPLPAKYLAKSLTFLNAKNEPSGTTVSYTFEKDAAQNLTKAVVRYNNSVPGAVLTWNFEYDCDPQ